MPMPAYRINCYERGCRAEALYKIAARWSDGITAELKTYGLVCEQCLPAWFRNSLAKRQACRRAANETLDLPGIYRLRRDTRDVRLERLSALEQQLTGAI